jgi:DNA (cytosine-5)-methyltransferase 1
VSARADAVDLFCGIGWAEGMSSLGMTELGIDLEPSVIATRDLNGYRTLEADLSELDPRDFKGIAPGLIASPPCPDWSQMGKRAGRTGESGHLVDLVPLWVAVLEPGWVVCEQVPDALPVWKEHGERYRELGYSVWRGILNAADYGVPQCRERAILIATRGVAMPPEPTHQESGGDTFFGTLQPWVTASTVLGDVVIDTRCDQRDDGSTQTFDASQRPATTLTTKSISQWQPRITVPQALELQSFRPDLRMVGGRMSQGRIIGNAVPPLMAAHIIASVTGVSLKEA